MTEEKNKQKGLFTDLFKWNISGKELQNQIENYDTLGFFSSSRKIATALMIFSAIITLIFAMVGWFPSEIWIDIVLILILASFVYKGQKWAMIVTMIYWTFSKGFQLVSGFSVENFSAGNIIMPILWWAIFMGVFWQAYQVERAHSLSTFIKEKNKQKIFNAKRLLFIIIGIIIISSLGYSGIKYYFLNNNGKNFNYYIEVSEIEPYLTGVVKIHCPSSGTSGSGSLWNLPDIGYVVITNEHVITEDICQISVMKSDNFTAIGLYEIDSNNKLGWNNQTDVAVVKFEETELKGLYGKYLQERYFIDNSVPKKELNYKISNLSKCPNVMPIGSPVVIVGYPAFALTEDKQYKQMTGLSVPQLLRAITNGIISAQDNSVVKFENLPYPNYFISAKMDSGSSGGVAFSKTKTGLCVLGIPTWITIGNYETQGVVQNIYNVMYVK